MMAVPVFGKAVDEEMEWDGPSKMVVLEGVTLTLRRHPQLVQWRSKPGERAAVVQPSSSNSLAGDNTDRVVTRHSEMEPTPEVQTPIVGMRI